MFVPLFSSFLRVTVSPDSDALTQLSANPFFALHTYLESQAKSANMDRNIRRFGTSEVLMYCSCGRSQ